MNDGAQVRTLEELRENFELESVLGYYANGQLVSWLRNNYYDDIANNVEALDNNTESNVTLAEAKDRIEHEKILKQLLTEEQMKLVATNDEELDELIENGAKKVYLASGSFYITDDSIEYEVIKQTSPFISGFYTVDEGNFDIAKKYADNGIAAAQYEIGLYYYKNDDNVNSQKYILLAADQDFIEAIEWLSKNDCKVFEKSYFNRVITKAESGNIDFQFLLGNHYRRNKYIPEAEHWLRIVSLSNSFKGKQAKKLFEKYDYYFTGEGIDKTPSVLGDFAKKIYSGLKNFFGVPAGSAIVAALSDSPKVEGEVVDDAADFDTIQHYNTGKEKEAENKNGVNKKSRFGIDSSNLFKKSGK